MKTVINLTPHPIIVAVTVNGEEVFYKIPPERTSIARVKTNNPVIQQLTVPHTYYSGSSGSELQIPVSQVVYAGVNNLPEPQDDVVYIVSAIVATACKERTDVFAPDTGASAVRGENGNIVAVRGFLKY